MIYLPRKVEDNEVLKRLFYWHSFSFGKLLEAGAPEENVDYHFMLLIGAGGYGTEIKTGR